MSSLIDPLSANATIASSCDFTVSEPPSFGSTLYYLGRDMMVISPAIVAGFGLTVYYYANKKFKEVKENLYQTYDKLYQKNHTSSPLIQRNVTVNAITAATTTSSPQNIEEPLNSNSSFVNLIHAVSTEVINSVANKAHEKVLALREELRQEEIGSPGVPRIETAPPPTLPAAFIDMGTNAIALVAKKAYDKIIPVTIRSLFSSPTTLTSPTVCQLQEKQSNTRSINNELEQILLGFSNWFRASAFSGDKNKSYLVTTAAGTTLKFLKSIYSQLSQKSLKLDESILEEISKNLQEFELAAEKSDFKSIVSILMKLTQTLPFYFNGLPIPNTSASELQTDSIPKQIKNIDSLQTIAEELISCDEPESADIAADKPEEKGDIRYQKKRLINNICYKAVLEGFLNRLLGIKISKQIEVKLLQVKYTTFIQYIAKIIDQSKFSPGAKFFLKLSIRPIYTVVDFIISNLAETIETKLVKLSEIPKKDPSYIFDLFTDYFEVLNGAFNAAANEPIITSRLSETVSSKIDAAFAAQGLSPEKLFKKVATQLIIDFSPKVKWTTTFCEAIDKLPTKLGKFQILFTIAQSLTKIAVGYLILKPLEILCNGLLWLILFISLKRKSTIENLLKNVTSSFSDYRNYVYPVTEALYKQLTITWREITLNYNKESNDSSLEKSYDFYVRGSLSGMIETSLEVLEKMNIRTISSLKTHIHSPSFSTKMSRTINGMFLNHVIEACSVLVHAVSSGLLSDEGREKLVSSTLISLNRSFLNETNVSPEAFAAREKSIDDLISRILSHALNTIIQKKIVFRPVSQEQCTASFVAQLKEDSNKYLTKLKTWIKDQSTNVLPSQNFSAQNKKMKDLVSDTLQFENERLQHHFNFLANSLLSNRARLQMDNNRCLPLIDKLANIGDSIKRLKIINDSLCKHTIEEVNEHAKEQISKLCVNFSSAQTESFYIFLEIIFGSINPEHPEFENTQKLYTNFANFYRLMLLYSELKEFFKRKQHSKENVIEQLEKFKEYSLLLASPEKELWDEVLTNALNDIPSETDEIADPTKSGWYMDLSFFERHLPHYDKSCLDLTTESLENYEKQIQHIASEICSSIDSSESAYLSKDLLIKQYKTVLADLSNQNLELETLTKEMKDIPHINFEMGDMSAVTEILQKTAYQGMSEYVQRVLSLIQAPYNGRYAMYKLCQTYLNHA